MDGITYPKTYQTRVIDMYVFRSGYNGRAFAAYRWADEALTEIEMLMTVGDVNWFMTVDEVTI